MALEDRIRIATPEGVELDLALAGLGSRFLAAMLDTLLQFVLWIAPLVALGTAGESLGGWGEAFTLVWTFLVWLGYYPIFEALGHGRTLGKRAAGIRVVREHGGSIGFVTSAVRNLIRIIDFLPIFYGVGVVAILVTPRSQRLGDLAAGTYVVRERRARSGPSWTPPAGAPVPSGPGLAGAVLPSPPEAVGPWMDWDVSGVSAAETELARRFLERRWTLQPHARAHLAGQFATRLRPKVPGIPDWPDETVLECVVAAKSARG